MKLSLSPLFDYEYSNGRWEVFDVCFGIVFATYRFRWQARLYTWWRNK